MWRCVSDKPSFCFAILTDATDFALALGRDNTLYVPDWLKVPREVTDQYRQSHVLNYMFLGDGLVAAKEEYSIRQIADERGMEDFALAQARGFCEDKDTYAEWMPWLREADMRMSRTRAKISLCSMMTASRLRAPLASMKAASQESTLWQPYPPTDAKAGLSAFSGTLWRKRAQEASHSSAFRPSKALRRKDSIRARVSARCSRCTSSFALTRAPKFQSTARPS
jgi:hypothetical protein